MKVVDLHSRLNGEDEIIEFPSGGMSILGDDEKELFSVSLNDAGQLEISTNVFCKYNGVIMDTGISVRPRSSNHLRVERDVYVMDKK